MRPQSQADRVVGKLLLVLGLLLVVNSAYIAASGDPTLFYVINGLAHPALGIVVAVLFFAFLWRHRGSFAGLAGKSAVAPLGFSESTLR
jgi:hypothetical protein